MNIFSFAKTELKNLFSTPATRAYPLEPRNYPERTRGHVVIDINTCVLCGMCSRKCPADAIKVDRAAGTWSIERFGCVQCGNCVVSCPKKCLSMGQAYTEPDAQKRTDTFTKPADQMKPPVAPAAKPAAAAAAKPQKPAESAAPAAEEKKNA
ncbi:MAG: 4Fe-4S dicluster domain-containing protein [Ruminococcaceae bacterium]|nr:4Fe-4S dicluster domain-containing protein [Oscillospiraceae bacterium]HHV31257.1 4Fe-4S dicluster domain-containing protein [Clostridiales bacterium]